jgi:type VI protein secretion system component VasK
MLFLALDFVVIFALVGGVATLALGWKRGLAIGLIAVVVVMGAMLLLLIQGGLPAQR